MATPAASAWGVGVCWGVWDRSQGARGIVGERRGEGGAREASRALGPGGRGASAVRGGACAVRCAGWGTSRGRHCTAYDTRVVCGVGDCERAQRAQRVHMVQRECIGRRGCT